MHVLCVDYILSSHYIIYKVEFVDKGYGINLTKGKHYNIIPNHPLFHTKVVDFNFFFSSYFVQMTKIKVHS